MVRRRAEAAARGGEGLVGVRHRLPRRPRSAAHADHARNGGRRSGAASRRG